MEITSSSDIFLYSLKQHLRSGQVIWKEDLSRQNISICCRQAWQQNLENHLPAFSICPDMELVYHHRLAITQGCSGLMAPTVSGITSASGLLRRGITFFSYLTKSSSQISSKSLFSAAPHRPVHKNLISQNFQFPSWVSETAKSCFHHMGKATSLFYIQRWMHTKQRRERSQRKHKPLSGCGKILGSQ